LGISSKKQGEVKSIFEEVGRGKKIIFPPVTTKAGNLAVFEGTRGAALGRGVWRTGLRCFILRERKG